jgi:DNA-binding MarR family transcriptional regulator
LGFSRDAHLTRPIVAYTLSEVLEDSEMVAVSSKKSAAETIATECVAFRMRALNRLVTGAYDDALRPLGLRVGQLSILAAIACMKEAKPAALCATLRMEKSTLSRDVKVLVRQGWVEECPAADARARPLRLSTAGARLLEKSLPAWRNAQAKAKKMLGEAGTAALFRAVASPQAPR